MSTPTTLLTLPSELIEAVLICSCSPRTVAAVAQTCRTLHTLVYESPGSHLWRELFLATWDDPRPALDHRALVDPRIDLSTTWDWAAEYRRRISADKWLKAWRRDICLPDHADTLSDTDTEWRTTALSALTALLDTFLTFRPFPVIPPIALTVLTSASPISPYPTGNVESGVGSRRERMTNAPPLPPLLLMLASGISVFAVSRSGVRVGRMVYGPHTSQALGDGLGGIQSSGSGPKTLQAELELAPVPNSTLIPTPSLPPQLARTLLASRAIGIRGLPPYAPFLSGAGHWGADPLGDVFHRIVCITGFVPIPPPLVATALGESTSTDLGEKNRQDKDDSEREMEEDGGQHMEKDDGESDEREFPSPSQQHADARILARRRVYDMQYLRGDRLWGPYHVVTRAPLEGRPGSNRLVKHGKGKSRQERKGGGTSGTASGRRGDHLGALAWAMGIDVEPEQLDSDSTSDDSKDEDWIDPAEPVQESYSNTANADTDVDIELAEPEHPLISLILASANNDTDDMDPITNTNTISTAARRRPRRSNPRLPPNSLVTPREIKSHHLRPDYTYLASARIVVEANLRDLFGSEMSNHVERTASAVRPGEIGMFWEDEDEIMRARAGSSQQVPFVSCASSSPTAPSTVPIASTNTTTFELVDILSQFNNLETARPGSACGYWDGWIERQRSAKRSVDEEVDTPTSSFEDHIDGRKPKIVADRAELENPINDVLAAKGKGKGKARDIESTVPAPGTGLGDWEIGPEGEACEGWDWAGVAGIWRRCLCWMDYRELLFFNLDSTKFLTLDTQEACRIIPMDLRVTGYSRAGLMPVYDNDERSHINVLSDSKRPTCTGYFRPPPIIHFCGTSVGSDRGMDDGRKIRGNVQLIGGGEVRWEMDTYTRQSEMSASSMAEWSSEGVQIGGIGSAIGLLGMWTGAGHERADPLGPFWAWKVA